ncbi:hypothetical protein CCHR01_19153 [Colletotrichum chrysophilum]|uniref:Uncharacterized protein n=1 Tax=Colletotrichum chrysophilum TaxID=1836956 RepID=A0AAD8ZZG4_9PEZI|nr:hypothetical protein CCHR01_19153 [Colletotrichum chrysophilum]
MSFDVTWPSGPIIQTSERHPAVACEKFGRRFSAFSRSDSAVTQTTSRKGKGRECRRGWGGRKKQSKSKHGGSGLPGPPGGLPLNWKDRTFPGTVSSQCLLLLLHHLLPTLLSTTSSRNARALHRTAPHRTAPHSELRVFRGLGTFPGDLGDPASRPLARMLIISPAPNEFPNKLQSQKV